MIYPETEITSDPIFSRFIQSMNEFTHNGTLTDYDSDRALELALHYIRQCPPERRNELSEQIIAALSLKYHYQNTERLFEIRKSLEFRVMEQITRWVKTHFSEPVKMAGFLVQWSFNVSLRLFKTFIEPAVTQTALTYSMIINPAMVPLQSDHEITKRTESVQTESFPKDRKTEFNSAEAYQDLQYVNWYTEALVENLGRNHSGLPGGTDRSSLAGKRIRPVSGNLTAETPKSYHRLRLNIDRRRLEPVIETARIKVSGGHTFHNRPVRELRPASEIHNVLMENDYKFQNCFKPYRAELPSKERRLSVRFDITPSGTVSNISIGKMISNRDIIQRLKIQLVQLRFSKVETRFGDQTIYHTFFF